MYANKARHEHAHNGYHIHLLFRQPIPASVLAITIMIETAGVWVAMFVNICLNCIGLCAAQRYLGNGDASDRLV